MRKSRLIIRNKIGKEEKSLDCLNGFSSLSKVEPEKFPVLHP